MQPTTPERPGVAPLEFLEAYPDAVAIHRRGELMYVNRAGLRLVGAASADEVLGRSVLEFVHPDSRAVVVQRMQRTAEGSTADLIDERFITLTGEPLDVQVVAIPIVLVDGPATQLIVRDVTELRRMERLHSELEAEANRARSAYTFTQEALDLAEDAAGLGVWDWDVSTGALRWTNGLEPLHGMEPGSFRGTFEHFLEAVHEADRPGLLAVIDSALKGDSGGQFEARMRVNNGQRWILGKGRVFRDEQGTPLRMVGIGLDVTERTKAEMALDEQRDLVRLVTGLLPANVAYFDKDERYRFVNETYRTWFGVEPESVIGKTAREFMGKRAYEICAPSLRRALAGEPAELEMDILNPAGGRRYLQARYMPDIAADGSVRGVVALINDVTALHHATAALEVALAAKDDFVGFTTHELKTPLTVIIGFANVLARRAAELDAEALTEIGQSLDQEGRRLEEIVENMLLLARAERGGTDEPALLHRSAEKVLKTRRWRPEARPRSFRVTGSPGITVAPGGWLEHVIENLLSNAEKYSEPSAPIDVEVAADGEFARLTVLDRGRGVTAEESARLFEPFFRARPDEVGVPGIGLGLTVCRKLVARLGGEIWLRPRDGGGTEAGFRVPISASGAEA